MRRKGHDDPSRGQGFSYGGRRWLTSSTANPSSQALPAGDLKLRARTCLVDAEEAYGDAADENPASLSGVEVGGPRGDFANLLALFQRYVVASYLCAGVDV